MASSWCWRDVASREDGASVTAGEGRVAPGAQGFGLDKNERERERERVMNGDGFRHLAHGLDEMTIVQKYRTVAS